MNFKERSYSKLRIAMLVISGILCLACFGLFLYLLISKYDPYNRLWASFGTALLFLVPVVVDLIFHKKVSDFIITFYIIYMIFAGLIGSVFYLYNITNWYDKLAHSIFGYVGGIIGLYVVCKLSDINSHKIFYTMIVCFAISLACGAVWEIWEFSSDMLFHQQAQGKPLEVITGEYVTPVTDTMFDLICNFCGTIVFCLHYLVHKKSGKNLTMGSIIKDFTTPYKPNKKSNENKPEEIIELETNDENKEDLKEKISEKLDENKETKKEE